MTSSHVNRSIRFDPPPSLGRSVPSRSCHLIATLILFYNPCPPCECEMPKRVFSRSSSTVSSHSSIEHVRKRRREAGQPTSGFNPNYTATAEDAARVDAKPPLQKLLKAASGSLKTAEGTEAVVHWMRMADLRSKRFNPFLS